jgi:formylglycine-generating enzyme required for sulfatase activity
MTALSPLQLDCDFSPASQRVLDTMVWIPAGTFRMGSDRHFPEEAPAHDVFVDGFWMDPTPVTNAQFAEFARVTNYVTAAEQPPDPEDYPGAPPELLAPGSAVFRQPSRRRDLGDLTRWWVYLPGACWRHPEGPGSGLEGREAHPVVHLTYDDAEAYARWAGKELPSEVQWERAARGGLSGAEYCWGNEPSPDGRTMANVWQGDFPWERVAGHERTSPVGAFPPNGYGLFDMTGNVWEWTCNWFFARDRAATRKSSCCVPCNPAGSPTEVSQLFGGPRLQVARKVLKGGSFLCAAGYCRRYRPAARFPQAFDSSTCHIGFRCVTTALSSGHRAPRRPHVSAMG